MTVGRLALLLLFHAVPTTAQEQPSAEYVQNATRQVAQVIASQCQGGTQRSGTAFVWPDAEHIVTARHVVAGCAQVRVQFPGGPSLTAMPVRERAAEDLLVLRLSGPSGRRPAIVRAALPPIHSRVAAVGYALGAPTPDDKLLTVTSANREPPGALLRDMLPARIRQEVQSSGPWSLDTAILRLDGNLVSGLSGAPLFAADGTVVAIGAGGLQEGASGIVWAVRARYLLEANGWRSVGSVAALTRPTSIAFADQVPQAQVPTAACGALVLSRARTVSLADLARDTDDPRGLQQILAAVGGALSEGESTRFDVWVDQSTGASIPMPAGTTIISGPVGCMATLGINVGLNIVTFRAPAGPTPMGREQIQQFSSQFERSFMVPFPYGLPPDNFFTYVTPVSRPDGFVVNRKAWGAPQLIAPNAVALNYVFITHMTRGETYAGVSALRQFVLPADATQACLTNGNLQACQIIRPAMETWAMAAIAVHMATMPPI